MVEHCPKTNLFVGSVPGFPGAHSQAESLEELRANMREVIAMLLEDGKTAPESEFVGTETLEVSRFVAPPVLKPPRGRSHPDKTGLRRDTPERLS